MRTLPGLDLERAGRYLVEAAGGRLTGALRAEVIAGGKSNLTYLVHGESGRVVVRRPPLGLVLPSAHDMAREYQVTSALYGAGYPVARPLLLVTDEDVIGAPFYVMEYVQGVVLRDEAAPVGTAPPASTPAAVTPLASTPLAISAAQARHCGELLVDALLRLHAIDPAAAGLGRLGRPEGYLSRQVSRWRKQWEASRTRELPLLDSVADELARRVPESPEPAIVHGDYRLDNVMFSTDLSAVAAVMDWEMATVGDPLADVGLLVVYTDMPAPRVQPLLPGFPGGPDLARRYAAGSGLPTDRLDWYVALGAYKLAVICEGIHARYLRGKTVGAGFERIGETVVPLLELAGQALGRKD
ncbi:MAG: phosphotransferase family protein [Micromonosporaceae bacterium]|nr:phosphotransferase family protein [Micromonosporaceae bacterium]